MAKSPEKIFIDTSFFKALVDADDEFHNKSVKIWEGVDRKNTELITSNYVLDESFTLIRIRCGIEKVQKFKDMIASSGGELKIIRVTIKDEAGAWKWFENDWAGLSFTDCVSFFVMKRLGGKKILTFDKHFKRAGFDIVNK